MNNVSVYLFLRILLLLILFVTGYYLAKPVKFTIKEYWKLAAIAIFSYSFIEGLRFDRGRDYLHYKALYENAMDLKSYCDPDSIEPFFQLINKFFSSLSVPYPYLFVFYSFLLIYAGFFLLKKHRMVALFAVPMFFMATMVQSENLVRQFIAISFVLISLEHFLKNAWLRFYFWFVLAFLTHFSSIIFIPFFFLFKYIKNPFGNLYIILGLYFISWLWEPEYWGNYYQYFQLLQSGDYYREYIDRADLWFSGEKIVSSSQSTFYLIRLFLFNTLTIVIGHSLLRKYKRLNFRFYYFLFIVGAIFQRITEPIELLYRLTLYFYLFWFIVLAYISYDSLVCRRRSLIVRILSLFLLSNVLYDYMLNPLIDVDPDRVLFIWNVP